MAGETTLGGTGLSDALTILGAAGIVIPAFARLKISPVIGFILVGIIAGPFALGALAQGRPWLEVVSISNPAGIEPFAELGIIFLLFAAGLHLSFRRLASMRRAVFGVGAAELLLSAGLIAVGLAFFGERIGSATALGAALALSSTALVLPIAGTKSAVGRAAFAMLLFEDLALVPILFLIELTSGAASMDTLMRTAIGGALVICALLLAGRFVLPGLFAQAARTKSPELFLSISLLVVMVASLATASVGLSPILGALLAGVLVAETEYGAEVETVTAPLSGLALGVFLIAVGMRIDLGALAAQWPLLLAATVTLLLVKAVVTAGLLRASGARHGTSLETGVLMASPSETSLIVIAAAASAGLVLQTTAEFWTIVTALGLTITPLLAKIGRLIARRVDHESAVGTQVADGTGRTVIFGFGRVGQIVADMLIVHNKPYVAIESDIDAVKGARAADYKIVFGDVARRQFVDRLNLNQAAALVLTMNDPVLTVRLTKQLRELYPDLVIVARARDTTQAAELYRAGVTDAVPETLESSLQLAEAVLVDIGLAMGPVIASIHDKRSGLRTEIMSEGQFANTSEPGHFRRQFAERFRRRGA
jgi:CPA2 family monovalent cation:H+ antiporter-2